MPTYQFLMKGDMWVFGESFYRGLSCLNLKAFMCLMFKGKEIVGIQFNK